MGEVFRLSERQFSRLTPLLPTDTRGKSRVDDVRVISGIVPTVRHANYIGSWLEVLRDDDRAIIRAASAASKAADYLLTFQPDEGEPVTCPPPVPRSL